MEQNPNTQMPKKVIQIWTGIVQQTGTSNPTVVEIHNTFGVTPSWAREATGAYVATFGGKIFNSVSSSAGSLNGGYATGRVFGEWNDEDSIRIMTVDNSGAAADSILVNRVIEIRNYLQQ